MAPGLLVFIALLTVFTGLLWLRLVRMILRGDWPSAGLAVVRPVPIPHIHPSEAQS